MSECHARLSLHPYVMYSDVVGAIYLFEANLARFYGYSYLIDAEKECFGRGQEEDDKLMCDFHRRLNKFNEDYGSEDLALEE